MSYNGHFLCTLSFHLSLHRCIPNSNTAYSSLFKCSCILIKCVKGTYNYYTYYKKKWLWFSAIWMEKQAQVSFYLSMFKVTWLLIPHNCNWLRTHLYKPHKWGHLQSLTPRFIVCDFTQPCYFLLGCSGFDGVSFYLFIF